MELEREMKVFLRIIIPVIIVVSILLIVPKEIHPPGDNRVILEHTYSTYIVPSCFETAEATNYLEESTVSHAQDIDYDPHSECTEKYMEPEKKSLLMYILYKMGLVKNKWSDWI